MLNNNNKWWNKWTVGPGIVSGVDCQTNVLLRDKDGGMKLYGGIGVTGNGRYR